MPRSVWIRNNDKSNDNKYYSASAIEAAFSSSLMNDGGWRSSLVEQYRHHVDSSVKGKHKTKPSIKPH